MNFLALSLRPVHNGKTRRLVLTAAMEDAIALTRALRVHPLREALPAFEAAPATQRSLLHALPSRIR